MKDSSAERRRGKEKDPRVFPKARVRSAMVYPVTPTDEKVQVSLEKALASRMEEERMRGAGQALRWHGYGGLGCWQVWVPCARNTPSPP